MALLKALVIGMGVLIVLAMGLLAYGLVTKTASGPDEGAPAAERAAAPTPLPIFGEIVVPNAGNCRIDGAIADGNRLLVTLGGDADCRRVVVVDMASGEVAGVVRLAPAAP